MSIANEARGYEAVREFFQNNTNVKVGISIHDAWVIIKNKVRNEPQVRDAVKKYYTQGLLSRLRIKGEFIYWWKSEEEIQASHFPAPEVKEEPVGIEIPETAVIKPTVTVTADTIVVEHPACRVIIELGRK